MGSLVSAYKPYVDDAATSRSKNGKRSRTKGHSFERWVANKLRGIFPDAKRHLEYQKSEAAAGVDIEGTEPFQIQCKRGKGYAAVTAIEQIQTDLRFGDVPVLVTRADGKEAMAVLPFEAFLQMVSCSKGWSP